MNNITEVAEAGLVETAAVSNSTEAMRLIEDTRKSYSQQEARTRQGLADIIWQGYLAAQKLMALPADEPAKLLRMFEVAPATAATSVYTPWIKVIFGSWVDRKTKGGGTKAKWTPNRSYEVYHHAMHELADKNVTRDGAAWLVQQEGALKVALDRKKRMARAARPALAKREGELRNLLREYGNLKGIELPDLGDKKPEPNTFFTALIWNSPDGYRFVAVDNQKADAAAVRIATDSEAILLDRMRGKLEPQKALIEKKKAEFIDRATEMLASGTPPSEDRVEMIHRLTKKHRGDD